MFDKVKEWFNYSWSIFLARFEVLLGLVGAGIASVMATDFLPFISGTGVDWKYMAMISGYMFVKGIISELGRRQGTVTLSDGQLIPAKVNRKAEAKKVIEKKTP